MSSISPFCSSAQAVYGSYYHDLDSGANNGFAIRRRPDGKLFLFGGGSYSRSSYIRLGGIILSQKGDSLLEYHLQNSPPATFYHNDFGTLLSLHGGDYLTHQSIGMPSTPAKGYKTSNASLIRFKPNGDTVWVKTYTDTNMLGQVPYGLSQSSLDSSFVIGGRQQGAISGAPEYGFLLFVDSAGNQRRTITYQHPRYGSTPSGYTANYTYHPTFLPDGQRVLVTESARTYHTSLGGDYFKHHPWVFICDTQGTILKQRVMAQRYSGAGTTPFSSIDHNGGYYLVGSKDTIIDPLGQPTSPYNYPKFLMHLDTNLNTNWTYSFGDTAHGYYFYTVKQLRNGNYLLIGSSFIRTTTGDAGWLAVVNANGTLKWSRRYHKSTTWHHQLFDAIENADGSITAVGYGKSDTSARATQTDIWVLNVDSNGCEGPTLCGPSLAVEAPSIGVPEAAFRIYPNPTTGTVTIESKGGEAVLYSLTGAKLWQQTILSGTSIVQLPRSLATGVYLVRFTATDGSVSQTRLTYQP